MACLDEWRPTRRDPGRRRPRPGLLGAARRLFAPAQPAGGQGRHRARRRPAAARRRRAFSRSAATASSARTSSRPDLWSRRRPARAASRRAPRTGAPIDTGARPARLRSPPSISARPRSSRARASWRSRGRRAPIACCAASGGCASLVRRSAGAREGGVARQGGEARTGSARRHAGDRAANRRRGRARRPFRASPSAPARRLSSTRTRRWRSADRLGLFLVAVDLPWMDRPDGRWLSRCASGSSPARNPATSSAPS